MDSRFRGVLKNRQTGVSAPPSAPQVHVSQWRGHSCPRIRELDLRFFNTPFRGNDDQEVFQQAP